MRYFGPLIGHNSWSPFPCLPCFKPLVTVLGFNHIAKKNQFTGVKQQSLTCFKYQCDCTELSLFHRKKKNY